MYIQLTTNKRHRKPLILKGEYLPCPFCGNKVLNHDYSEYKGYWVECPKCEVCMERDTKKQTINDWNKRVK